MCTGQEAAHTRPGKSMTCILPVKLTQVVGAGEDDVSLPPHFRHVVEHHRHEDGDRTHLQRERDVAQRLVRLYVREGEREIKGSNRGRGRGRGRGGEGQMSASTIPWTRH